jgi:hypothetical protein
MQETPCAAAMLSLEGLPSRPGQRQCKQFGHHNDLRTASATFWPQILHIVLLVVCPCVFKHLVDAAVLQGFLCVVSGS